MNITNFRNPHYLTRGIAAAIPLELQILLWEMIDTMKVPEKDYLQVFSLSVQRGNQHIVHEQEQPPYRRELELTIGGFHIAAKIFVIDDDDHSTMLLADEY